MTAIERTAYPRFKQILSAKDLAEVYTPTPQERLVAHRSTKGRVAEVGFLILLKTYQRLGHFVPLSEVPPLSLSISPSRLSLTSTFPIWTPMTLAEHDNDIYCSFEPYRSSNPTAL